MKKKYINLFVCVVALFCLIYNLGIGYRPSGAAARDLKTELMEIYGEPYVGLAVENGTEDMEISVEPASFFLTSWDVRHFFSWDYEYTCKVTYTVRSNDKIISVRTVTYKGVDPMGYEKDDIEAHLVLDSRKEEFIMEPQRN